MFELDFQVRDYECDLQGIVNNAVYQNYLEHTRHEFLMAKGISFSKLSEQGVDLVVRRAELEYLKPLHSGDHFTVFLQAKREKKIRFHFEQSIIKTDSKAGDVEILRARFECTSINKKGRPFYMLELEPLFNLAG